MRLLRLILFISLTYIMNEKIKLNNYKNKFFINKKKHLKIAAFFGYLDSIKINVQMWYRLNL